MNSQAESNNESSDRDIADPFQVSSTTDDMLMKSKYIYYININLSFYCFIYLKYYITFFFFTLFSFIVNLFNLFEQTS